jgi:hypothetical protein
MRANAGLPASRSTPSSSNLPDFAALQKAVHSDPYAIMMGAFDIPLSRRPRSARQWLQGAPGHPVRQNQAEQPDPV